MNYINFWHFLGGIHRDFMFAPLRCRIWPINGLDNTIREKTIYSEFQLNKCINYFGLPPALYIYKTPPPLTGEMAEISEFANSDDRWSSYISFKTEQSCVFSLAERLTLICFLKNKNS